jgi:hypothetical protein
VERKLIKMAGIPVPTYQQFWTEKRSALKTEYKDIVSADPDVSAPMHQLFRVLCDIEDVASFTPSSVGESEEWAAIVSAAEDNRESFCVALRGKPLFSALYGTYTVTLNELKNLLKARNQAGHRKQAEDFKEVRSRKRHSTGEAARTPKKATVVPPTETVRTSNFFAPLRSAQMDTDAPPEQNTEEAAAPGPGKTSRPPPIVFRHLQPT